MLQLQSQCGAMHEVYASY